MTTTLIRKNLINFLENADEKKVKAVYTIFENEINEENSFILSEEQIKILDSEKQKHLSEKANLTPGKMPGKLLGEKRKNRCIN